MMQYDERMIVVNTAQTFPAIAHRALTPPPGSANPATVEAKVLDELADATRGDWPNFSDKTLGIYADYLMGTCGGVVTTAYRITGQERLATGKIRFEVEPAVELTPLIGMPQPGGPWKRGEARGTRALETPAYPPTVPAEFWDLGTWTRAVLTAASVALGGDPHLPGDLTAQFNERWNAALNLNDVEVTVRQDGTIVIEVPSGRDVLVRTKELERS